MQEREQGRRCPYCGSLFRLPVFRVAARFRRDWDYSILRRCPDCLEWVDAEDFEYEDMINEKDR
jgi:uncharacterized C2H2 Zn-finger protein